MNILVLNCYDPKHPRSGGAERYTQEIFSRLKEHKVTWLASSFKNASKTDEIDGIKILRFGNRLTVLAYAFWHYIRNKKNYDLVIDQFHGYPFLTFLYVHPSKLRVLIYEVADEIWDYMVRKPFNWIGKLLEKFIIKIYSRRKFITICNSTKNDLVKLGVDPLNIDIVFVGNDLNYIEKDRPKKVRYMLLHTGGLRPMKRVEEQIRAVSILKNEFDKIKLVILGKGDDKYIAELKKLVTRLDIEKYVEFTGFVTDEQRNRYLEQAYLVVGTSVKEGWGLGFTEGGNFYTPGIAYPVKGFVDSVKHLQNGLHTIEQTPEALYIAVKKLITDQKLYMKLQFGARTEAEHYTWDRSAEMMRTSLSKEFKD